MATNSNHGTWANSRSPPAQLSWVAIYWLLTRLFLLTSNLLRAVYGEPFTSQRVGAKGSSRDPAKDLPHQSFVNNIEISSTSGAGLDFVDKHRSSAGTPRGEGGSIPQATRDHVPEKDSHRHVSAQSTISKEDLDLFEWQRAEQNIAQQELELQAQIRQLSRQEEEFWLSSATHYTTRTQQHQDPKYAINEEASVQQRNGGDQIGRVNEADITPFGYTPEQLAEAASFAKDATRGQSSRRQPSRRQPSRRCKVNGTGVIAPDALKPNQGPRPGNAHLNAKSDARALDPRRSANLNFTTSPGALPPHLKKLQEAKAANQRLSATEPSPPVNTAPSEGAAVDESKQTPREIEVPPAADGLPHATATGYSKWETGVTNQVPKRRSFEHLLQNDQASIEPEARHRDSGDDVGRLTPEPVPSSTRFTKVSAEVLKAFDPKSLEDGPRRRREERLPGAFMAGVERGLRIVRGQQDGLQRTVRRPHLTEQVETTQDRVAQPTNQVGEAGVEREANSSLMHLEPEAEKIPAPTDAHDVDRSQLREESALEEPRCDEPFGNDRPDADDECDEMVAEKPTARPTSQASSARKALAKEMAALLNKNVDERVRPSAAVERDTNVSAVTDAAQEAFTSSMSRHELDLVGLDFSLNGTSPKLQPDPALAESKAEESLVPKVCEFAPGPSQYTPSIDAQALAQSAPSSHPKDSSANNQAVQVPPRVPLYVPQTYDNLAHNAPLGFSSSATAATALTHTHATSIPSSNMENYFTLFGLPEREWSTYPSQNYPQFGGYHATGFEEIPYASQRTAFLPQPVQNFTSAGPVHARRASSKAVAIVKPPEQKYNEQFPKLPSKRPSVSAATFEPPPGLTRASGSQQSTFDALLARQPESIGQGPSVATSNPFDALLENGKGAFHPSVVEGNVESREEQGQAGCSDADSASKTQKKKRKHARITLAQAWVDREAIRKRVSGCYTLDGVRALEYSTRSYNDLRRDLANLMASGELREEDSQLFPRLAAADLSAPPRGRATAIQKLIPEEKLDLALPSLPSSFPSTASASENKAPKKSDEEIDELTNAAIAARNVYSEAYAFFTRPPPRGSTSRKDLIAQGEARIERAIKYYKAKRDALTAAYGGALPVSISEKLWTYDDEEKKRERGSWPH